jgi:hypothetical protein
VGLWVGMDVVEKRKNLPYRESNPDCIDSIKITYHLSTEAEPPPETSRILNTSQIVQQNCGAT